MGADATWLAELRRITAVFVMPRCAVTDAAPVARGAHVMHASGRRFDSLLHELGVDDKGLVGVLLFGLGQGDEDQAQGALREAQAVHMGWTKLACRPRSAWPAAASIASSSAT